MVHPLQNIISFGSMEEKKNLKWNRAQDWVRNSCDVNREGCVCRKNNPRFWYWPRFLPKRLRFLNEALSILTFISRNVTLPLFGSGTSTLECKRNCNFFNSLISFYVCMKKSWIDFGMECVGGCLDTWKHLMGFVYHSFFDINKSIGGWNFY